eukprot:CFRG8217T1
MANLAETSESNSSAHSHGHVRFSTESEVCDNDGVVGQGAEIGQHDIRTVCAADVAEGSATISFGLLKKDHIYTMRFEIVSDAHEVEMIGISGVSFSLEVVDSNSSRHVFLARICAEFEGKISQTQRFVLKSANGESSFLDVILICTVMRKGSGTPSLKPGVKLVGSTNHDSDYETEWTGFS